MQEASTTDSKLKYVLFSAHDTTLMAIMSAFHQPLAAMPPYSADLNILLTKDSTDGKYYVAVKFQDNPVEFKNCQGDCSLADFMKYLS